MDTQIDIRLALYIVNMMGSKMRDDSTIMAASSCCVILVGTSLGVWCLRLLPAHHLGGKNMQNINVFGVVNTTLNCKMIPVYLEVEACPLRQVPDLNVKLQPAVPQHFFIEGF